MRCYLNNPDLQLEKDENSPEALYETLYKSHEDQNYAEVISKCDEYIELFEGEKMASKFEFLKATAIGRLNGYDAYKESMNYIALNYPNTPEGKQAERLIQEALPKLASKDFSDDNSSNRFKVIYKFIDASKEEIEEFVKNLNEVIKDVKVYDLTSSIDVYDKNTTFVVVHGLKSIDGAKGFAEILGKNKKKIIKDHIPISSKNYEIIQIHKNLESYLEAQ